MMAGSVTHGAGEAMGLEVMLFADKEKYFLTSAFFEGFKVSFFVSLCVDNICLHFTQTGNPYLNCNLFKIYVHRPDEFPLVRDRGFALGPGQEMFVSVDAVGEIFHKNS